MTKLKRLIVHAGNQLAFDMKLMPDGTWKTTYGPGFSKKTKKRPRTGRMASLMRKHKKWLNR